MNTFEMKTAIHFGDNALDRLKEIPYKRVLIITDPFVVQSKMINLITAPLNSAGIEYDIFHDVVPDAPVDKIAEGVKKFLEQLRKSRSDRNSDYKWYRIRSYFFCSSKRYCSTCKISADLREPYSR